MMITFDEVGAGPAVTLLHSTVCDRRMWDSQMPALADAGFRAIRCDFRGFGETAVPDRAYNNAEDVRDVLDHLGIERGALVAASGGGRAALEFAARWPERVTALVLLCTAAGGFEPSPRLAEFGDREDTLLEAGDVDGATDLNVRTWLGPSAGAAVHEFVRQMQKHAFEVQLAATEDFPHDRAEFDPASITAPTLLVSGAYDLPDFTTIAAALAQAIPGARHVHLDWAGHLPNLERPEEINRMLLSFLDS